MKKENIVDFVGNPRWLIATPNKPMLWSRTDDEVWPLVPPRRYLIAADEAIDLAEHLEQVTDLQRSAYHKPLHISASLSDKRILIDRYRQRGIGDLLFLTGPMSYMMHVSGGRAQLFMYGTPDRASILTYHPALFHKTVLLGPVEYDHLPLYHYHWLVDTVTEFDDTAEQLNVYDALFQSLGCDIDSIDPQFKRPSVGIDRDDQKLLDSFFYMVFQDREIDFRHRPYYLIAPFSHSSNRSMDYATWMAIVQELAAKGPTIVMGKLTGKMPTSGMPASDFLDQLYALQEKNKNLVVVVGNTPLRLALMLCGFSRCVVSLDSGLLYMAQAQRTPVVSIWGTHNPAVRIGYDKPYMDLAVWEKEACHHAPCFSYSHFPAHKCPKKEAQRVCEVLRAVDPKTVLDKVFSLGSATKI